MKVLVCGAGGFIGRHLVLALHERGHVVVEGRYPGMDFSSDVEPATWIPRLAGLDAVVNAVGVLRDTRQRPMESIHSRAPVALFTACGQTGVRRVIQISALGAERSATRYARSKLAAEVALQEMHAAGTLSPTIVRPSLVFGRGGASSELFMRLARLVVLPFPEVALRGQIQPLSVRDLSIGCVGLLEHGGPAVIEAVGPVPLTVASFVASLRAQLGLGRASVIPLPRWLNRLTARAGDHMPWQPWCSETLALLDQNNVGNAEVFGNLLPRPLIAPDQFLERAWQT